MGWKGWFRGGILLSTLALAACGSGGEGAGGPEGGDSSNNPSTGGPPDPDFTPVGGGGGPLSSCSWTLVSSAGSEQGMCEGGLGGAASVPISVVRLGASESIGFGVELTLREALAPGTYTFDGSALFGSVSVVAGGEEDSPVYVAYRYPRGPSLGAVTWTVQRVDGSSGGTEVSGRIEADVVQPSGTQAGARLTVEFTGSL